MPQQPQTNPDPTVNSLTIANSNYIKINGAKIHGTDHTIPVEAFDGIILNGQPGKVSSIHLGAGVGSSQFSNITLEAFNDGGDGGFVILNKAGAYIFSPDGTLQVPKSLKTSSTGGNLDAIDGDLILRTPGNGLRIKDGINATIGHSQLSNGTVTISTNKCLSTSKIFLNARGNGADFSNRGFWETSSSDGSFTVISSNNLDNSAFDWWIINDHL